MPNEISESELIRRAKDGDQQAMSLLVERHSGRIYNLALRLMDNREDAEDVLQETFMILVQKLHTFSERSTLYTWLYRIATNVALGKLRQKKIVDDFVSVHDPDFEHVRGFDIKDWPDHLEEKIDEEEFRECLRKAMAVLPENYREVFVLRDLENLSTRETAKILDISEANVKVRLMRARLFLRDQLANHFQCVEGSS
ncbi:MAG: sigma-70 family RNA polymerase sigma factor [Candidatus Neomarinimicrobiota bacterium]|nr:MAG: sigma-70 family RNA polymerase sigma factor [Candidatus Neomarinimicrobiota bacterium]